MSIQNPNKKIRSEGKPDQQQTDAVDRLSSLPDHVLHHLLSFIVESRFSVQTSVLSRRWRSLWKHVPRLTLRDNFSTLASTFARYVDALLSARPDGSNVDEINYCDLEFSWNTEPLHKVIQFAASRRCRELSVTAVTDLQPYFLAPLADNSNLTTLELRAARLGTGFGGFSSLRVLHLDEVSLPCSSAADLDLFVGFPSLEKLVVANCVFSRKPDDPPCCFKVSGPRLAHLLIVELSCAKVEIFAPNLKFLNITEGMECSPILYQLTLPISLGHYYVHDNGRVEGENKERTKALLQDLLSCNGEFLQHRSDSPLTGLKFLKVMSPCFPEFRYVISHVIYFMKGSPRYGPETIEFV